MNQEPTEKKIAFTLAQEIKDFVGDADEAYQLVLGYKEVLTASAPSPKTGRCCRRCNPGANGNYQAGMGGCFDPECVCHAVVFNPATDEAPPLEVQLVMKSVQDALPISKTSDEVVKEALKPWEERRDWFIVNMARIFQKYFGKNAEPCPDCGGSMWTVCEKNLREMYAQAMDKTHEYDVGVLTALVARVREDEKIASAEYISEHVKDWKKEGALAVLADLEEWTRKEDVVEYAGAHAMRADL